MYETYKKIKHRKVKEKLFRNADNVEFKATRAYKSMFFNKKNNN